MNLALKYRPKQFSEVVGQRATSVLLQAMVQKSKLSQVLLFTGPSGVGKTSMARIIAAQLNSEGATDVHEGIHPAVIEIDGASNGSVEAIRKLKRDVNFAIAGHRVVIIDEVHAISDAAFAALLNLLEFPPKNVTFILITTESHKIPKTIRHRCDSYTFKKASVEDLFARLQWIASEENIVVDNALIELIAHRAEGSFREACMLLEQISIAEIATIGEYNELQGEVDFGPTLILSTLNGSISAISQLESVLRYSNTEEVVDRTVETLRDVMLLKGGISLDYTSKALEIRQALASKLSTEQLLKAIRIVWDLQTKLKNADSVRGLEMAYALLGDILGMKSIQTTNNAPMSMEQMKNYSRS